MTMHILRGDRDICHVTKETHDSKCSEATLSNGKEIEVHTANRNEQIGGGCSPRGSKDSRGPSRRDLRTAVVHAVTCGAATGQANDNGPVRSPRSWKSSMVRS